MKTIEARMKNPALMDQETIKALFALGAAAKKGSVPAQTLYLVQMRVSQLNGCSLCLDMHAKDSKKSGETDERLFAVGAWREAPYFTDAERAALALAEAATCLSHQADAVPDAIWDEAARHYDEAALGNLVVNIALINFWNRINVATRQLAGSVPH